MSRKTEDRQRGDAHSAPRSGACGSRRRALPRRARADLELPVETSGVVVLRATTGNALPVNRETKRILGSLLGSKRLPSIWELGRQLFPLDLQ